MISGWYILSLYCEHPEHMKHADIDWQQKVLRPDGGVPIPDIYEGESRADCIKQARDGGWLFKRNGDVFCRYCRAHKTVKPKLDDHCMKIQEWEEE